MLFAYPYSTLFLLNFVSMVFSILETNFFGEIFPFSVDNGRTTSFVRDCEADSRGCCHFQNHEEGETGSFVRLPQEHLPFFSWWVGLAVGGGGRFQSVYIFLLCKCFIVRFIVCHAHSFIRWEDGKGCVWGGGRRRISIMKWCTVSFLITFTEVFLMFLSLFSNQMRTITLGTVRVSYIINPRDLTSV